MRALQMKGRVVSMRVEHVRLGDHRFRGITSPPRAASSASPAGLPATSPPTAITVNAIAPGLTRSPGTLVRQPRPGFATMDEEFVAVASLQAIMRVEVPDDLLGAL